LRIDPGIPVQVSLQWNAETEQLVGRLAYRDGIAYLEYDKSFLESGLEISPLNHPLSTGLVRPQDNNTFEGLHGVFADSLPDGWGRLLLDRRARQLNIDPASLTPLDRLACVGNQALGALVYQPMTDVWGSENKLLSLNQLAKASQDVLKGSMSSVVQALGRVGGSPGGARPKALISINDKQEVILGWDGQISQEYAHYLVKFRGYQDPVDIAQIEMAYAQMAIDAGIEMPETRLLSDDNQQQYFAIRRFDIVENQRLHIHTASGLFYANISIPSLDYKDLIQLTRILTRDQREVIKLFRLAVFNVLSHNRDDHARQFSFSMDRTGLWKLAPAYDLTWSTGPGGEHSTSVLGHGKNIDLDTWIKLGREADIEKIDVLDIVDKARDVTNNWTMYAERFELSKASTDEIASSIKDI